MFDSKRILSFSKLNSEDDLFKFSEKARMKRGSVLEL
jgi:hypothetical protein